jgi:DNA-binding XRE family transcriptional regulator
MAKKITLKTMPKPNFAQMFKMARNELEWTQSKLAEKSSVAIRTIVSIEKGHVFPKKVVIIRLAYALGKNIKDWLRISGYPEIADKYIDEVITASGHLHFAGERDPESYFREVHNRLCAGGRILMCVAYHSPPAAPDHPELKKVLIDSIRKGLSLAMVCPFPRIFNLATVAKPALSFYYHEVFNRVLAFARDLYDKLEPEYRNRIGLFVPDLPHDVRPFHYIHPPTGLGNYRPTLVVDLEKKEDDAGYELAVWMTMSQDQRNRWLPLFPSGETSNSKYLNYHKDYFTDFIAAATPTGWDESKLKGSGWRMEFPIKSQEILKKHLP